MKSFGKISHFVWFSPPLLSGAVTTNSPQRTASTATTLETKCCRQWAGKKAKASDATSRASRLPSRYEGSLSVSRSTSLPGSEVFCSLSPQAQLRTKGAGLGTKGTNYNLTASDTYKDAVRKAMFARFTELEDWEQSVGLSRLAGGVNDGKEKETGVKVQMCLLHGYQGRRVQTWIAIYKLYIASVD